MNTPLFHLSPAKNVPSIQVDGLKASDDGAIYAFTDMFVADTIACNQVFARRYGVFRIMRQGITGTIEPDDVAEFAAPYQRRIIQARIAPRHLRYLGTIDTDTTVRPTPWDYLIGERIYGQTRMQVDEEYAWRRRVVAELAKKPTKEAPTGPTSPTSPSGSSPSVWEPRATQSRRPSTSGAASTLRRPITGAVRRRKTAKHEPDPRRVGQIIETATAELRRRLS